MRARHLLSGGRIQKLGALRYRINQTSGPSSSLSLYYTVWFMRGAIWQHRGCRRLDLGRYCSRRLYVARWKHRVHDLYINTRQTRHISQSLRCSSALQGEWQAAALPEPDVRQQLLDGVLARARDYGIDSLVELQRQADVGHRRGRGTLTTDLTASRFDLELWSVLLDFRQLQDGLKGVGDILYGMRWRGSPVKLFVDDSLSTRIWNQLLPVIVDDESLVFTVCNPDRGLARELPTRSIDVMKQLLLAGLQNTARKITKQMQSSWRGSQDFKALFDLALEKDNDISVQDYWDVHYRLPRAAMYSYIIRRLWKENRASDAFTLHSNLLEQGDYPSSFDDIVPFVRFCVATGKPLQPFLQQLDQHGLSYKHQIQRLLWEENALKEGMPHDALDLIAGSRATRSQRKLPDNFVARAFATRALSFGFILRNLSFFGLPEIGPLAMREIAISADDIDDLKGRLRTLDEMTIDTGSSALSAIVRRLCQSDNEKLLYDILHSDQHHDVFEDAETQKRLLAESYYRKDWPAVNRSLAILNRGRIDRKAMQNSFQMLFKAAIVVRDWRGALIVYMDRHRHDLRTGYVRERALDMTLIFIVNHIIPPNRNVLTPKEKRIDYSKREHLERIRYAAGLLQDLQIAGITVAAQHWKKLLVRLGARRRWNTLEDIAMWIGWYYCRSRRHTAVPYKSLDILNEIFGVAFQAKVIRWSFIVDSEHYASPDALLATANRGIMLLRRLQSAYGITVDYSLVKARYMEDIRLIVGHENRIPEYSAFFDATWAGNLSRVTLRKYRKALRKRSLSEQEKLNLLTKWSEQDLLLGEELGATDDWDADSFADDIFPEVDERELSVKDQQDIVEYQDFFHPSSKEYKQ